MKKIVLVDDDPIVVRVYKQKIASGGFDVQTAVDGLEAVRILGAGQPDLVILDVELPDMDGFVVTSQLKAQPDPSLVVLLSMHNNAQYQKRGRDAGCDAYVGKESGWVGLLTVLRKIMKDKE